MRNRYKVYFPVMLSLIALTFGTAIGQVTLPQVSGAAKVQQTVGITQISVNYARPNVVSPQGRDRTGKIWGNQVPFGYNNLGFGTSTEAPWRAGANENTTIEFSTDVMVEGKSLAAGTYGFHVAVFEDGRATAIFSKDIGHWGSYFYDKSNDVLRVDIQSQEIPSTNLLEYRFIKATTSSATLALDWEKKRIPISFEVDTKELTYQSLKSQLQNSPGFNLSSWTAAANYLVQNNIHLDEALNWANAAVEGQFFSQKNFQTLSTRASVLVAMGKEDEAFKTMDEALANPSASINNYYAYGRQLIGLNKDSKALEIFKKANKKWPNNWLAPHGLARGYSAAGDFKNAIKYEKLALSKAPDGSKQFVEGYLKTLKEGKDFN